MTEVMNNDEKKVEVGNKVKSLREGILRVWYHNARLSEAWPSTGAIYTNTL